VIQAKEKSVSQEICSQDLSFLTIKIFFKQHHQQQQKTKMKIDLEDDPTVKTVHATDNLKHGDEDDKNK
jgi:hypothetical protein